ncbi:MAG: polyisoprenyl-teichoic acid--peptidoglycan teichoic acid transferase, partial [Actinomycetota bacterium]|nr:polyisoprenyl-teichoic acid--peptidoglycan teichoic acid transferase [Actinomycetota bacterium]
VAEEEERRAQKRHRPKHRMRTARRDRLLAALQARRAKELEAKEEGDEDESWDDELDDDLEAEEPVSDEPDPEVEPEPSPEQEPAQEEPELEDETEVEPVPLRRPPGPRKAALQQQKRRTRETQERGLALSIAAAIVVILVVAFVANRVTSGGTPDTPQPTATPEKLQTLLVVGTKQSRSGSANVRWITLLTYDTKAEHGAVVSIPAHTAVEVPGRGLQTLGDSLETGGVPLLLVTAENLLGLSIDSALELSDKDAQILLQNTGSLTVDVPTEVRVSLGRDRARLIFSEGTQTLKPARLVSLLYTVGLDGDDIELGARHLAFWDALFDSFSEYPGNLSNALQGAGAVMGETEEATSDHIALLGSLTRLSNEDRSLVPLPVTPLEVSDNGLYVTNEDEVKSFVRDFIGKDDQPRNVVKVQILNGRDDAPGIGADVAALLVHEGYNVILSGNAPRLNYKRTLVIVYDSTPESLALAERTRDLLGTGVVQVSTQDQGIVDITIVVGKDFQRAQ